MVTEDDCVHALREAAQLLGDSPTKAQYEDLGLTPSASTILRQCGGWNDAKRLAGLETNYSRGSRVEPKPDGVDLPEGLAWDELSQDQRWHYRNRDWNAERSIERKKRHRAWLYELKRDTGCSRCAETDAACLDFHHHEDAEKWLPVSKMVTFGYALDSLRADIEKCEVICANCHRKEHLQSHAESHQRAIVPDRPDAVEPGPAETRYRSTRERQREWARRYKRRRTCTECSERDPRCLEFHHPAATAKDRAVSQMITDGCTADELFAEIAKCMVLCTNCHRKQHYDRPEYVDEIYVDDGIVRSE